MVLLQPTKLRFVFRRLLAAERPGFYASVRGMKRQSLISQGSLSRLLKAATESFDRSDYQQCIEILERASRMDPANPVILLELGRVHGMRYDYTAAERHFDKAARLVPRKADMFAMAGVHCRGFGRFEMAKHYFERAVQEQDVSADTFVKLAELYERFRCLEEASELVERALRLDKDCALALLVRARLHRLKGSVDEAEKIVRSLVIKTDPESWSTRIRGWYELGAIFDKQGRYDEAMSAFLEAKAMIRPNAGNFLAGQELVHTRLKEVEKKIPPEMVQRWLDEGGSLGPKRRVALLCGHPRSGTTLLEQVLDSHPDIISAEETTLFLHEVSLPLRRGFPNDAFMLTVLESMSSDKIKCLRQDYFRAAELFLGSPIGERLLIDKNPVLTALVLAAVRVFPEIKFLTALRDPRDVVLSCFMQPLPLNQVSAMFLSLEGTVKEYESLMGFWRAAAPALRNSFIEVRYEEMVADLESVSRRVLEFLQVPWDARVLRFNEYARQKLVRSPTYADVAKPIFKGAIGRWRNYQKHLEPHLEKLAPFVKAFGYG
jgi:tetratricopeptide (TPR) repeat protein